MPSYILVGTTRGDDLIPSRKVIVAGSHDRALLEKIAVDRAAERKAWLETHQVPHFSEGAIYEKEEVIEASRWMT